MIVNGVPVIRNSEHTGAKPGMACRANTDPAGDLPAKLDALVNQARFTGAVWGREGGLAGFRPDTL